MEIGGIGFWIWAWIVLSAPISFLAGLCVASQDRGSDEMESMDAFKEEA